MVEDLAEVERFLDKANTQPVVGLAGGVKAELLATVCRVRNKLDALEATVLSGFEATAEHRAEGHASPIGWLKHHTHARGPDAARRRRVARALRSMPLVHDALRAGRITVEHVEALDRVRRLVGDEAFDLGEEVLVDYATTERFGDFVRTLDYFVERAAPEGSTDRQHREVEERWASSEPSLGGCGNVGAWMDRETFAVWQPEMDRLSEFLYRLDVAEAHDHLGRRPLPSELGRTHRQRRLDAMRLMAERSAAYGDEQLPPSRHQLIVHAGAELVGRLMEALLDPDAGPEAIDEITLGPDDLCETDEGVVVTVNTVLLALLTGTVRGILYDPQGEILRFGRNRRIFSPAQALALRARFRRCLHPYGCDRTGQWLESDHEPEYQDGGRTDIDHGRVACHAHNVWKTNTKGRPPPAGDAPPDTSQRRAPPRFPQ